MRRTIILLCVLVALSSRSSRADSIPSVMARAAEVLAGLQTQLVDLDERAALLPVGPQRERILEVLREAQDARIRAAGLVTGTVSGEALFRMFQELTFAKGVAHGVRAALGGEPSGLR
jgi:hypothetical protein